MRVGATLPDELERVIAAGGRRGEIYAGLKAIRDRYADLVRARFPKIPRRVSGYNLDFLLPEHGFHVARALVGSDGTCVTILEATTRLVPSPPCRSLVVLGYRDVYLAADAVPLITSFGPIGLEGVDEVLAACSRKKHLNLKGLALLPEGTGWLYVEFGADTEAGAEAKAHALITALRATPEPPSMRLFRDPGETALVWAVRESALGAVSFVPGQKKNWEGWEDAAVEPARLGGYLRDLRAMMARYGYTGGLYGHFGQGCVHTRIDFDLKTPDGIAAYRRFVEEAADLVVRYGGSLSGEHGDGQSRGELLPRMFGPELMEAFRQFKALWDPGNKMNPGKLVSPYRLDEHLRVAAYHPPDVSTHFAYLAEGSFADAAMRCVGVGKCRKTDGGAMCPSYMGTGEETHATRGRARLLFEMMQGEVITDGFRSDAVREALDLCLSCKSCKTECPVGVDMATYKAEFLAHYYEGRRRPLRSYVFGLIHRWSAMAEYMPWLANAFSQTRPFSTWIKAVLGVAPERRLPAFAPKSFRRTFAPRETPGDTRPRVLLWADTFNNYFQPDVAHAAAEVLDAAGFRVAIPRERLCCGRPLYDHGMLSVAKRQLQEILRTARRNRGRDAGRRARAQLRRGVPRRAAEPVPVRPARAEAEPADVPVERVPRSAAGAARPAPAGARTRSSALPPSRSPAARRRGCRPPAARSRFPRPRRRVLRDGRRLRLRRRALRRLGADRRTRASVRRPRGRGRRFRGDQRFQLPRTCTTGDRPPRVAPGAGASRGAPPPAPLSIRRAGSPARHRLPTSDRHWPGSPCPPSRSRRSFR